MTTNIKADSLGSTVKGKRAAAESAADVTYTMAALARIAGISRQRLMRWEEGGFMQVERGQHGERAYSRVQALCVIALADLWRSGVKAHRIRAAAAVLPISLVDHAYLVFDGRMIYARSNPIEVVKFLSETTNAARVLSIATLAERLA